MGPKAEGGAHTNPGKTAKPNLPAWIQTLVRKVSCSLKMLKLQREIKTVLPCWIKSVFPEMFHGLVEVKGWDSEKEGKNVLPCNCGSVCEQGRACGDVFACGMAGNREAASRQGIWQPLPAGRAAGWMALESERGLLSAHGEQGATLKSVLLDGTDTPKPFCSFYLEPRKCAVFFAAIRGNRESRLAVKS